MTTIGILASQLLSTQRDPFWWNPVAYTRKGFLDVLQQLGATPILLPVDAPEQAPHYVELVDKLLLTGGADVSPQLYGEDPQQALEGTDPARDAFELAALKSAMAQGKSVFGVCRGLQLLNVALGGSLYQDLSSVVGALKHRQSPTPQQYPTHSVSVATDSSLSFLPHHYQVNSFHHQAVKALSQQLTAIATAPDGIVEAVEAPEHRLLAVQWHPECTWRTEPHDLALFRYFVEQL